MEQMHCDVVVVGAGPAGSVAAYECAKQGLKTLLLEKSSIPRAKPCGGAVMYHGLKFIHGDVPSDIIERKIYGMRFGFHDGSSSEFVSDKLIGITVFRERFDAHLAKRAAEAGAELLDDSRVVNVSVSNDCAKVELQNGKSFKSEFLIGADGVNSIVSRSLGLRPKRKNLTKYGLGMEADFHVGTEGVIKATHGNPSVLQILPVENRVSYGWMFPKREHLAIGIAGGSGYMQDLRASFDGFCKNLEKDLGIELKLIQRRTGFLGGAGLESTNVTDRTILVGDAAGFVDPMMGEGIAYSMQSSALAVDTIIHAMAENQFDAKALWNYHSLCQNAFSSHFQVAGWAGAKGISYASSLLPHISGHQIASDLMAMVARGEIGYADIPYMALRKLPRQLPTIIKQVIQSHVQSRN